MAPQHDEIVKHLDDGFTVAWDSTARDAAMTRAVRKVATERAAELGEIFGVDIVAVAEDEILIVETKSGGESSSARRSRPRKTP